MSLRDLRAQARRRTPEERVAHLASFEIDLKFSAGIWFFSPPASRFHDRYGPVIDIPARLEIAARLAEHGLQGMEAHYPSEINEENLDLGCVARNGGVRGLRHFGRAEARKRQFRQPSRRRGRYTAPD